jgi:hypothetical protein
LFSRLKIFLFLVPNSTQDLNKSSSPSPPPPPSAKIHTTTNNIYQKMMSEMSTSSVGEMYNSSTATSDTPSHQKRPCLNCILYNPKNFEINEQLKTANSVSFIGKLMMCFFKKPQFFVRWFEEI